MNMLWNVGEMMLGWAFPQVGATIKTTRWAHTAYKATKVGAAVLTGDVIGGLGAAAHAVTTCESIRDECINAVMAEKIYLPDDALQKGWKVIACNVAYWVCKLFK